jgi:hypothetical protein
VLLELEEDLAMLGLSYEFWNLEEAAPKCHWASASTLVGFVHGAWCP